MIEVTRSPMGDEVERQQREAAKQAEGYLLIMQEFRKQADEAARGMAESFGNVGKAIGALTVTMANFGEASAAIEAKRLSEIEKTGNATLANAAAAKESTDLQLQYEGDLVGSAKQFFDKKSAIYAGLQAAEMAYRAIQMARAIESIAVAATETAATTAAAGTQASAWGIAAFAHTLASLPIPL
jgi:hypothetical protein